MLFGLFFNSPVHCTIYSSVDLFRTAVIVTQYRFLEADNFFEMGTSYIPLTWDT